MNNLNSCPKCVGLLEDKTIEEIPVEACNVCHGLWFESLEALDEIIKLDMYCCNHTELNNLEFENPELKATPSTAKQMAKCPLCNDEMLEEKIIYTCPRGHGLWLDGGEIHKLRKATFKNILITVCAFLLGLTIIAILLFYTSNARSLKQDIDRAKKMAAHAQERSTNMTLYPTQKMIMSAKDDHSY